MRNRRKHYGLIGDVQLVETTLLDMSTKSYKLYPNSRELWNDFGNPSVGSPENPLLWEILKFDVAGRLVEDVEIDRPLIEQESYRYKYEYDAAGQLTRKTGYRESGIPDENIIYRYGPTGKKVEQLLCSVDGRVGIRYSFDERENMTVQEIYNEDGSLRDKISHRYEYSEKGEALEQMYYPPSRFFGDGYISFIPPIHLDSGSHTVATPLGQRTLYVHNNSGRVREEHRYDIDGSLLETKLFDDAGVVRRRETRLGELGSTTYLFDEMGRQVEIHTFAKKGILGPRDVDDRTVFCYDEHGNMTEMITKGPDGAVVQRISNLYAYDSVGNWTEKTETDLSNTWQIEPFPAAFETISVFHRNVSYF